MKDNWFLVDTSEFHLIKHLIPTKYCEELIKYYREVLESELIRDDYKECAELALLVLGESPTPGKHYFFKKPQCLSNARWMARIIYSIKTYMFQSTTEPNNLSQLEQFCVFCVTVYLPAWFKVSFLNEAPLIDIEFAKKLKWFVLHMFFFNNNLMIKFFPGLNLATKF